MRVACATRPAAPAQGARQGRLRVHRALDTPGRTRDRVLYMPSRARDRALNMLGRAVQQGAHMRDRGPGRTTGARSRHRLSVVTGVLCRDKGPVLEKKNYFYFFVFLRVLNVEDGWCLVGLKSQFNGLLRVIVDNEILCRFMLI